MSRTQITALLGAIFQFATAQAMLDDPEREWGQT